MLPFSITFHPGLPARLQLETAIRRGMLTGQLAVGERLPGWHIISSELRMHPDAVREALATLRAEGWLGGDDDEPNAILPPAEIADPARIALVRQQARELHEAARRLGLPASRLKELIDEEEVRRE